MRKNKVKEKLKAGKPSIGVWSGLDHPGVSEILADAGFDWIVFDTEHGHFTTTTLRSCLDAMRRTEVSPLVRVAANDAVVLKQILELGPEGVVIPMVCTAEQAKYAVAACKYPPQGIRGIGAGRASHYGGEFKSYLEEANDNICIIIQIEHVLALDNLDDIVQVKGIDGMFIGPYDLSASMGITGNVTHPDMLNAIEDVILAGKKAGIATGMWCRDEKHTAEMISRGMQFIAYGEDKSFLSSALQSSFELIKELTGKLH